MGWREVPHKFLGLSGEYRLRFCAGLIDEKNAYGNPVEVVLERLKFLP
jgi:hypothetical protein